jgi:hypothetical protein
LSGGAAERFASLLNEDLKFIERLKQNKMTSPPHIDLEIAEKEQQIYGNIIVLLLIL